MFTVLQTLANTNPSAVAAIVRPNNPPPGIAGFIFDVVGDETTELKSNITDNVVEDNTTVQDHISLDPETITVRALMAELATSTPVNPPVAQPLSPLPLNPGLVPPLTPGSNTPTPDPTNLQNTQSLYNYYEQQSTIGIVGTPPAGQAAKKNTRQSDAFLFFYAMWKGRQLSSVETPYGIWTNMAILSLRAEQSETSKYVSDFWITFKKMRFAASVTVSSGLLAGRAAYQGATPTQNGNSGQTYLSSTALSQFLGTFP